MSGVFRRALLLLAVGVAFGSQVPAASATGVGEDADNLTVMTLNLWHGGSQVDDGVNTIVNDIKKSGADAVALQETSAEVTEQIADKLGWNHTSSGWDIDVVSRDTMLEVDQKSFPDSGAQTVAANVHGVWVYSVHLDYTKYGPYNACFDHDSYPVIYADEESRRRQAQDIVEWAGHSPAIIGGDFNSPSHLDWTERTRERHCASVVEWPTTTVFSDAGYEDSYREVNPNEVDAPGDTWSPVFKWNDDHGKPEPQDRIDFLLYRGSSLDATRSRTYGGHPTWPSDHLGVVTTFDLSATPTR